MRHAASQLVNLLMSVFARVFRVAQVDNRQPRLG